jgi:hypothetical protein
MFRKVTLALALAACAATLAAAEELTPADAQYYADYADAAKKAGKQLERLGDLFAKASSGKSYKVECEDRAADLSDIYHALEEMVPTADDLTAHKDLMASAEAGSQAALELASYFKDEFAHKEKMERAMGFYETAVGKYDAAMATAKPVGDGK